MNETILGLDLGPNSIGWALIDHKEDGASRIIRAGVRVFEAGLDGLTATSKGESRNAGRRLARQQRRQTERRARRMRNLARALQRFDLLPAGDVSDSIGRHLLLNQLDSELPSPYELRSRGLDEQLEPYELGRALYHLGHRRGFKSNRKTGLQDDKDEGAVRSGVSKLDQDMADAGARTLGEYFCKLDPDQQRIRCRYTGRHMYETEFEALWTAQQHHYPELLTHEAKALIHRRIFFQRPLKSVKRFIGSCQLETKRHRAPWDLLESQRFRYLQILANLRVIETPGEDGRPLTDQERQTLADNLEVQQRMKLTKARKLLGLSRYSKLNLEIDGDSELPGNRTAAAMAGVFGKERWATMSEADRRAVVEDWRSIVKPETLVKRGMCHWHLDEDAAEKLAKVRLEQGYCAFSRQAIDKLLPHLHKGMPLATAIRECYPERWARGEAHCEQLPPLDSDEMPDIRNPIVARTLTELRKVVNAIIKQYGKPDVIRIELARDLRQTPRQRDEAIKKMKENENERTRAAKLLRDELGLENPSRDTIEKVLLAEECGWTCPYTGKAISPRSLAGPQPDFDVEHIIPFHRSLDNSFLNKTLCCATENRNIKRDMTPYEAYQGTDKWDDILKRVKSFMSRVKYLKLKRFQADQKAVEEMLKDFSSRQLNDTRYASRLAKRYLGLLYGGVNGDGIDSNGRRCVQAITGPLTAQLRRTWGLNGVLGDDDQTKSRDDHRHHAVDAIVIALASQAHQKLLSDAARRAAASDRLFENMPEPWEGFRQEAVQSVNDIIVSHRVDHRVRGSLHEDTIYSRARTDPDGKAFVTVRKPLKELSQSSVGAIVDPVVREMVAAKLRELDEPDPQKAFQDEKNLPRMAIGNGRVVPIRRARIRKNETGFDIGPETHPRHVLSKRNHHMEIFRPTDRTSTKWFGRIVNMFEAYRRCREGFPVVDRTDPNGSEFVYSLAPGDCLSMDDTANQLAIVRSIWEEAQGARFSYVLASDSRSLKDIKAAKQLKTAMVSTMSRKKIRKLSVSILGDLQFANN